MRNDYQRAACARTLGLAVLMLAVPALAADEPRLSTRVSEQQRSSVASGQLAEASKGKNPARSRGKVEGRAPERTAKA